MNEYLCENYLCGRAARFFTQYFRCASLTIVSTSLWCPSVVIDALQLTIIEMKTSHIVIMPSVSYAVTDTALFPYHHPRVRELLWLGLLSTIHYTSFGFLLELF